MLTGPSAVAQGAIEIKERIEAAFGLSPAGSTELARLMTRKAITHGSQETERGTALLAYGATDVRASDPMMALLAPPTAGQLGSFRIEPVRLPRPRPEASIITGSIAPQDLGPDESAIEEEFFGRFAGSFAGSGEVRRSASGNPNRVTCTLAGQPSENRIVIAGACGVSMFSREISADIRYDPASGRYSGVYVGAKVGPARLSGTRNGDAVVLAITWPKPVNGDTRATMTIRNAGDGQLAITVTDEFQPGGAKTEVTRLALNQI